MAGKDDVDSCYLSPDANKLFSTEVASSLELWLNCAQCGKITINFNKCQNTGPILDTSVTMWTRYMALFLEIWSMSLY